MSQDGPHGKWYWVLQGYRWRVITTAPSDDSMIISDAPCMMPADIKPAFEAAINNAPQFARIYLVQWEERARWGSQEWERVAGWDGRGKKTFLLGSPSLEDTVREALRAIDPSPALG